MNFLEFLKYYTILIAAFMPLSIASIAYLNKKTGIIRKFDSFLDRVLYHETAEKASEQPTGPRHPEEAAPTEQPAAEDVLEEVEKTSEEEDENLKRKEKDEEMGIAWFQLKVGDAYRCRINNRTAEHFRNPLGRWTTENGFVGEIVNDKYFSARKTGRTYVFFGSDYDESVCIYNIEVVPTDSSWKYQDTLDDVFLRRNISDVKVRLIHTRLAEADFSNNVTRYADDVDYISLAYEHDERGRVARALYLLKEQPEDSMEYITSNLAERMKELVGINSDRVRIWTHEDVEGYVDYIAYIRRNTDGTVLFGIGRSWRINGEEEEVALNLPMVEKSFARCLGDIPLDVEVAGLGLIEENNERKAAPKKKASSRRRTAKQKPAPSETAAPSDTEEDAPIQVEVPDNIPGTAPTEEFDIDDYEPSDDQNYDE